MYRHRIARPSIACALGVTLFVCTASAFAASQITFSLTSTKAGQTVTPGTTIDWKLSVEDAGDDQGIAFYSIDLALRSNSASGAIVTSTTLSLANFTGSFNVGGNATSAPASAKATFLSGGPAMTLSSTGNNSAGGQLVGFGAGYSLPWTYTPKSGRMTPGVGRADQKATLLKDPSGAYTLNDGTFAAPAADGTYFVTMSTDGVSVLRSDLDLTQNQVGNFTTQVLPGTNPGDTITVGQFSFIVAAAGGGGGDTGGGDTGGGDTGSGDTGGGDTGGGDTGGGDTGGGDTGGGDTGGGDTGGGDTGGGDTGGGNTGGNNNSSGGGFCGNGVVPFATISALALAVVPMRRRRYR